MLLKDGTKELYKTTLGEDNDQVIIGDRANTSTFKPIIQLSKWGGEESLSIESKIFTFTNLVMVAGELLIENNNYGFYFNSPDSENLKFGILLKKKPPTNSFSLQLTGWENFDFCYQTPFSNLNPDGSAWELNVWGLQRYQSPGVPGSYAVYHKTKRDHIVGLTNYKCGKIGHLYCPKFIDALGNSVWGTLTVLNGVLTETIPQDFLNSATYPIRSNATFGYVAKGMTSDSAGESTSYLELDAASPVGGGTLTNLTICMTPGSTNTIRYAFYGETSNVPSTRHARDAALVTVPNTVKDWYSNISGNHEQDSDGVPTSAAWSYVLSESATQYWGAFYFTLNNNHLWWYDTAGGIKEMRYESSDTPSPAGVTSEGYTDFHISCFATYTAAGGALDISTKVTALCG